MKERKDNDIEENNDEQQVFNHDTHLKNIEDDLDMVQELNEYIARNENDDYNDILETDESDIFEGTDSEEELEKEKSSKKNSRFEDSDSDTDQQRQLYHK